HKLNSRLGVRFLAYLLVFSFFVSLIASGLLLFNDYKRTMDQLQNSLDQIQSSYRASITNSLWNFDDSQINALLDGISTFPNINQAYITDNNDIIIFPEDTRNINENSNYSFDLSYKSKNQLHALGTLNLIVDFNQIYDEIKSKALTIAVTQFIKTFTVSIFIIFLIRLLITRRLGIMVDWITNIRFFNNAPPLHFKGNSHRNDELDLVASALNKMQLALSLDLLERNEYQEELQNTKDQLSILVDNARLGYATYTRSSDSLTCNSHFARHLALSEPEFDTMEAPIKELCSLIISDNASIITNKINNILMGRNSRLHAQVEIKNFRKIKCFFDLNIEVLKYTPNGPEIIIICLLDKTKEVEYHQRSNELALTLEDNVASRTEALYEKQHKAELEIERLKSHLQNANTQISYINENNFQKLLVNEMQKTPELIKHSNLKFYAEYLNLSNSSEKISMDLVETIKEFLCDPNFLININIRTQLPFSLVLQSDKPLILFLLKLLINEDPYLEHIKEICFKLVASGDTTTLNLGFEFKDSFKASLQSNQLQEHPLMGLSNHIAKRHFQGNISRYYSKNLDSSNSKSAFETNIVINLKDSYIETLS
ncbi:MAG: hypothetical protein P1U57_13245, partial [Oleibacter sp.]|nr:hypothetical protein [Thalassolituus sp.]